MATENYGLPTFDGENATMPIQFKSTITQGFQKIDEVMKINADGLTALNSLPSSVTEISRTLENLKVTVSNIITALQPTTRPASGAELFTVSTNLPNGITVNQLHSVRVGLINVIFLSFYQVGTVLSGGTIAEATGNVFNLAPDQNFRFDGHRHIVNTSGGAYVGEGYGRIMLSYHSSDSKTYLVTYDMNDPGVNHRSYYFFAIPVTPILQLPEAPATLEYEAQD